jgi:hypothetical protein
MKPLLIAIRKDGVIRLLINPQDTKTITIDNKMHVTVRQSEETVDMPMTQYAVDKLRKELRDRYNIIKIQSSGITRHDKQMPYRSKRKANDLYEIYHDEGLTIVFPKAMHAFTMDDGVATIRVFPDVTFTMKITHPDELSRDDKLNLLQVPVAEPVAA